MTDAPDMEPAALEAVAEYLLRLSKVGFGYDIKTADRTALREAAAALTASEAEAADLRRKLEEHQDAEDKAAREMATVIQGLRNRATAAERKLEEARKALEPFAEACPKLFNDWCLDETPAWWIDGEQPGDENKSPVSVGDFRAAARALSTQVEERE